MGTPPLCSLSFSPRLWRVFYATYLANSLHPKLKLASVIGSFGWSTKAVEQIMELIPNLKVELLSPVLCRGCPQQADFEALDQPASAIAEKHKASQLG